MDNGEYLPISRQEYLPTMVDCEVEFPMIETDQEYTLVWYDNRGNEQKSSSTIQFEDDDSFRFQNLYKMQFFAKNAGLSQLLG